VKPEISIIMNDDWDLVTGGVARFVREIAPRLARFFRVTVISTNRSKGSFRTRLLPSGVEVVEFPNYPPFIPNIHIPRFSKALRKYIERSSVVFIQTLELIRPFLLARSLGKPIVTYFHAVDWVRPRLWLSAARILEPWIKRYCKFWYNSSDHLCIPGLDFADRLEEVGIRTLHTCIPAGIDTERFVPAEDKAGIRERLGLKTDAVIFGYVGRLWPEKNLGFLLRLFEGLFSKYTSLQLLLVGGGHPAYEREFDRCAGVVRVGQQSDVVPYLQAMDFYVHPMTPFETSSLSTMEAMSTGLPVVVNAVGRPREYVCHGQNGFAVEPLNDEAQFLRYMERLITHPDERHLMGLRAREGMIHLASWDVAVLKLRQLFEEVLSREKFAYAA